MAGRRDYTLGTDHFSLSPLAIDLSRVLPILQRAPTSENKKLDLWRLPEILVIHLKRFSYNCYTKNKLETYVDFPICELDLSEYIAHRGEDSVSTHYRLYAVSNHYGYMGGGYYTAYVYHDREKRWYDFDDRCVAVVQEDNIKTAAAYVLFYRRVDPTD